MKMHRKIIGHILISIVVLLSFIGGYICVQRAYYFYTGTPLLCRAVERGDLCEAQRLVTLGVSPARAKDDGESYRAPIDIAIARKHLQIVQYLVEHGAGRYNPRTGDDRLFVAAGIGSPEILAYLMHCYPNHDKAELLYYAAGGDYAAYYGGGWQIHNVKYLLVHGAESGINTAFVNGETALHVAKSPEIAAYLLMHGAHLSVRTPSGHTPLYYAVARGDMTLMKFYVERGLDVNATDRRGESILARAMAVGNPEIVAYLRAHGAR